MRLFPSHLLFGNCRNAAATAKKALLPEETGEQCRSRNIFSTVQTATCNFSISSAFLTFEYAPREFSEAQESDKTCTEAELGLHMKVHVPVLGALSLFLQLLQAAWTLWHDSPHSDRSVLIFYSFSLLLSDPKCTVCLVLPHGWSLPTHTSFLVAHASVFLRAYESLSSHILLSWGRPFSKPCATILEFTEGGAGKCCWILFWCLKWLYEKCCIEAIQYWKIHTHKYRWTCSERLHVYNLSIYRNTYTENRMYTLFLPSN